MIDKWIKKTLCVYIYICVCVCIYIYTKEYYSAIRKNEILPFATTWMDMEGIMLSEINETEANTV